MPKYRLTYFNTPGRAATTRHMFSVAGIEFEDTRLAGEQWAAQKKDAPLKQLPILDADGHRTICQSECIERFVAKVCGMSGSNDVETTIIDQIHVTIGEMGALVIPYFFGEASKDEEKKEKLRVSLIDEKYPTILEFMEGLLVANGGGDGYFVGSKPTLADIKWSAFAGSFINPIDTDGKLKAMAPHVFALIDRVNEIPEIKAFKAKEQR